MPLAMPRPVTLDDITYVFEPGRKCRNARVIDIRHCPPDTPPRWWTHQADRGMVSRYYVDMTDPVTVRIRICDCRDCGHTPFDPEGFRDAFMEDPMVVHDREWRQRVKCRAHKNHDNRVRAAAALAACVGVETEALTPGLMKRLLEVQ